MIRFAAAAVSLCLAANVITASAEEVYEPPVEGYSVTIPFSVRDESGRIPEGTVFTVAIVSTDGAPLPEVTEYDIAVSGEGEFGPIEFDAPGDYEYLIKETLFDSDKIVFDETVYHVSVVVVWDADGELTGGYAVAVEGSDTKEDELEFDNDYDDGQDGGNSDTDSIDSRDDSSDSGGDDSSEHDSSSEKDSSSDTSSSADSRSDSRGRRDPPADSGGPSSGASPWEPLLPPDTGGAVTFGVSGAVLAGLALILISKRKQQSDEPPDEGTG